MSTYVKEEMRRNVDEHTDVYHGFQAHTHPQLHTSMAGEYLSSPSRSSGGRYHSVITLLVYGRLRERKEDGETQHTFIEHLCPQASGHKHFDFNWVLSEGQQCETRHHLVENHC